MKIILEPNTVEEAALLEETLRLREDRLLANASLNHTTEEERETFLRKAAQLKDMRERMVVP